MQGTATYALPYEEVYRIYILGRLLTKLEEEVILWNILKLDTRGFAPQLAGVEDIANYILKS
jgi:hypothetical protein